MEVEDYLVKKNYDLILDGYFYIDYRLTWR